MRDTKHAHTIVPVSMGPIFSFSLTVVEEDMYRIALYCIVLCIALCVCDIEVVYIRFTMVCGSYTMITTAATATTLTTVCVCEYVSAAAAVAMTVMAATATTATVV